jgi:hypothetical protein
MVKRSDVRTLKNLVDQAYLIVSSDPIPRGGIESLRENLDAARRLARLLLVKPEKSAAIELGTRGGKKTAQRGPKYFSQIAGMRKTKAGGRPRKHQDVLSSGQSSSSVRSRSAFVIAKRAKELGMDLEAVAKAINSSVQYTSNLLRGTAIPSDEKIQDIINGLDFDNLKVDQIRTFAAEDRRRHDGRYRTSGI